MYIPVTARTSSITSTSSPLALERASIRTFPPFASALSEAGDCVRHRSRMSPPLLRLRGSSYTRCKVQTSSIASLAPTGESFGSTKSLMRVFAAAPSPAARDYSRNSATGWSIGCACLIACAAAWFVHVRKRYLEAFASVHKRVIVIGGGFAGMQVVRDLSKRCEVTLIDVRDFFEYTPGVLGALVGGGPCRWMTGRGDHHIVIDGDLPEPGEVPIRNRDGMAAARLGELHRTFSDVAPKQARLLQVAPERYSLRLGAVDISNADECSVKETVLWDYLVLATGSSYPAPLKPASAHQTGRVRARQIMRQNRVEGFAAAAVQISRAKHVLVIGGGVVGVELAAELAITAGRAPQRVTLVHSRKRLMDNLPVEASERARRWLERQGVEVIVGERFLPLKEGNVGERTTSAGHCYEGETSGRVLYPDEVLFAGGAKPETSSLRHVGFQLGKQVIDSSPHHLQIPIDVGGGIKTDENTLQVDCGITRVSSENGTGDRPVKVFCIGDAASKPQERYLASFAHWEAEYVSGAILADINQKALPHKSRAVSVKPFKPPPRLLCISLGPWNGMFIWGDHVLCTGILSAFVKLGIEVWFKNFFPAPYFLARLIPRWDRTNVSTQPVK